MEDNHTPRGSARSTFAQVLAVLALNWFPINVGLILSMPVIVIGALKSGNSSLKFTEDDASWFGGLIFIMQPLGSVVCGFLQDTLGRKRCFLVICIPILASWLAMYFASSVTVLFLASGTMGFSIGFLEAPLFSYVSEITEPHLRDLLASIVNISFNIGILALFFVGALVEWRTMVLISALGPIIAFICISMVPDSPAWLVTKGRVKDAEKAFQWLRGWVSPEVVQQELEAMISFVQNERKTPVVVSGKEYKAVPVNEGICKNKQSTDVGMEIFLQPAIYRPMKLILLYFLTGYCVSLLPIRAFYIEILDSMHLPIDSLKVMAIGGVLTLVGSTTASVVMRRIGIRGVSFLSMFLCVFSCLGIGIYLSLGTHIPWIPLVLVFISFYAGPFGVLFIPWVLISDLFPIRGKGLAGGLTAAIAYVVIFITTKTYYSIVSLVGVSGAFLLYGTVGALGFIYLYFALPETEGISLQVIQARYAGKDTTKVLGCQDDEEEGPLRTSESVGV